VTSLVEQLLDYQYEEGRAEAALERATLWVELGADASAHIKRPAVPLSHAHAGARSQLNTRQDLIVHLDCARHFHGHGQSKWNGVVEGRALITLTLHLDRNSCSPGGADPRIAPSAVHNRPAFRLAIGRLSRRRAYAGDLQSIGLE
jgi:hypothetical protein